MKRKLGAWFDVDKEGLAKVLARRGKGFVVTELIQNAWDTSAKRVTVTLEPRGKGLARIVIEDDDPEGFRDLSHAYTLFAESIKKGDPEKRGRFNIGEKLVLALCEEAQILTTTGGVRFDRGGRHVIKSKREQGSRFEALLRAGQEEILEIEKAVSSLIPPEGIETTFNGQLIQSRNPLVSFEAQLPAEIADSEGVLRRTVRKTTVRVFEPREGEVASIYEMGIPVVETGDKWHYDVGQKVPLNVDRDNVAPSYLRALRTEVLNHLYAKIEEKDAAENWVREASGDRNASKEAVEQVIKLRFGDRSVVYDPTDPEGTKLAVSQGYTVIPPRALSKEEWENVRKHEVVLPAGRVTPSPKPFSKDGKPLRLVPVEKWTPGMARVAEYARRLAIELLGRDIVVRIASEIAWPYRAAYGEGELVFNAGRLGKSWFEGDLEKINELLIHEFGHEYSSDHLSEQYHDALCKLGAKLTSLALKKSEFFNGV
ncbi:MAG: ATP-binding protein [Nitrososphaerales archaeon]